MFHSLVLPTSRFVQGGRVFLQGGPRPPLSGLGPSVLSGSCCFCLQSPWLQNSPNQSFLQPLLMCSLVNPSSRASGIFLMLFEVLEISTQLTSRHSFSVSLIFSSDWAESCHMTYMWGVSLTFFPRTCEVTGAACLFSSLKNLLPRTWCGWGGLVGSAGPPGPVHPGGLSCLNGHAGPVMEGGFFLHSVFSFFFFLVCSFFKKIEVYNL